MPKSIIFVNSRVAGYQSLIDSLIEPAEVFVLEDASDGLAQMAAYLLGRTGIDAIHIISHGSPPMTTTLDNAVTSLNTESAFARQVCGGAWHPL